MVRVDDLVKFRGETFVVDEIIDNNTIKIIKLKGEHKLVVAPINITKLPPIDWAKPLVLNDIKDLHFIGYTKEGNAVVQGKEKLYQANPKTGKVKWYEYSYIQNQLEPWEVAWHEHGEYSSYLSEKDWFKKVYQLGANSK